MRNATILIVALLMVGGCRDGQPADKSAEEARIETEVARRTKAVETELKIRQHRLHTIRVVGFILLAGGAVAGLLWVRQSRFPNLPSTHARPVLWSDHHPPGEGRVIDLAAGNPPALRVPPVPIPHPNKPSMRPRPVLEVLIVLGVVGLLLEIAEGHTWIVVSAGVAAALWLISRSH
jgi:hypothetical protein